MATASVTPAEAATRTLRTDFAYPWINDGSGGNWVGGTPPSATDDIVLDGSGQWGGFFGPTYNSIAFYAMAACYTGGLITVTTNFTLYSGTTCGWGDLNHALRVKGNISIGATTGAHLHGFGDTVVDGNVTIGTAVASTWTLIGGNASVAGTVNQGTSVASFGNLNINNRMLSTPTFNGVAGTFHFGTTGTLTLSGGASTFGPAVDITGAGTIALVAAGTSLTVNRGATPLTIPMPISGAGSLTKTGTGTLALSGANTFTGATTVSAGTLQIGAGGTAGSIESSSGVSVASGATLAFNRSDAYTSTKLISGAGGVTKLGTGTVTMSAAETYTGTTTVSGGTLTLAQGGGTLSPNNLIVVNNGATLTTAANAAHNFVYSLGAVGAGTITVNAGGTATTGNGAAITLRGQDFILNGGTLTSGTADSTHGSWILDEGSSITANNSSTISASGLNLRAANTDITVAAAQTLSVTGTLTTSNGTGVPSGAGGGFTKLGTGTLVLGGVNSHKAAVIVSAGTLQVNGVQTAATGATTVLTGATLGGTGTLGGAVTVNSGGHLAPGLSPGTLTMAGLSLPAGSHLDMELGQVNTVGGALNDLVQDNGNLTLGGGMLNVSLSSGGTLLPGTYRLINYTGTLTNTAGLVIGTVPAGFTASQFVIDTSVASQVNLIVLNSGYTYWDASLANNSVVNGGTGTWLASGSGGSALWTNAAGASNTQWSSGGTAIFAGTAGTVTVSNTNGAVNIAGLTFNTTGYTLSGGTLTGTAVTNVLTAATGVSATVGSVLAGSTAFTKEGAGSVTLSGANTYTGATSVTTGTLTLSGSGLSNHVSPTSVASGAKLSLSGTANLSNTSAAAGISLAAGSTLENTNSGYVTWAGPVTVSGAVTINQTSAAGSNNVGLFLDGGLRGSGTVTIGNSFAGSGIKLRNANSTFTGGLIVNGIASTSVGVGSGLGVGGSNNSLQNVDITVNGTMELLDSGVGWADVSLGTFGMGALSGTGAIVGNYLASGGVTTLTLGNTNNPGTFSGVIANGNGNTVNVTKVGTGAQTFSGASTYTGPTIVSAGKLLVNGNQSTATGAVSVASGATLGGTGTLGGVVTVAAGGKLAPGASPGTLTMPGLVLAGTSILDFELGQAGTAGGSLNDLVQDNGVLTLDGTVNITASSGGTFTPGVYRLINYTGALTNNTLVIGSVPAGVNTADLRIDTSVTGQVNLVYAGVGYTYWDAGTKNNGVVNGGSGTWQASVGNNNWTLSTGASNASWFDGGTAVFAGTAGTVTVDNALGAVNIGGLTFNTTAYTVSGGTLTGTTVTNTLSVGSGVNATVSGVLAGTAYEKQGAGQLALSGINTFTGSFTISGGSVAIHQPLALGTAAGGTVVTNGTTLAMHSGTVVVAEALSIAGTGDGGQGALRPSSSANTGWGGAITLTANATIANALGIFSLSGPVALGGYTLTTNVSIDGATQVGGIISGTSGSLIKAGSGAMTLNAAQTYTGSTTVSAGTLQFGIAGALPAASATTVASGATLDLNGKTQTLASLTSAGTLALGSGGSLTLTTGAHNIGTITGSGTLTLNTGASLSLTAALANSGVTLVLNGGTLNLGAFTHSIGTLSVTAASTLDFASAGNAQITAATLAIGANTLMATNWSRGNDHFHATAFTGASRNTIGAAPMNQITLTGYLPAYTAWLNSGEIEVMVLPRVRIAKISNGGTDNFAFTMTGLSATADSIATVASGVAAQGAAGITGTIGTVATIAESGTPAGWPVNPVSASCIDANGATNTNGTSPLGTLVGRMLTIPAANMVAGADLSCTFLNGLRSISGRLFNDGGAPSPAGTGANTGTPNDGIRNGNEGGLAGMAITLTDCASTNYATNTTDGSGIYSLGIPAAAATGTALCVSAGLPAGHLATGANVAGTATPDGAPTTVGSVAYTYNRALQREQFAAPAGGTYVIDFGAVPPSTLSPRSNRTGQAGSAALHGHRLVAGTGGTLAFSVTASVSGPAMAGWSERIVADPGCTGTVQMGAAQLYPQPSAPLTVVQGQIVCVVLQQFVPGSAQNGNTNTATMAASLTFTNAGPALSSSHAVDGVTTVSATALDLVKEVRNITAGGSFSASNHAKPGDVLEYRITYTNTNTAPMTQVIVVDATPAYSTFVSATAGAPPTGLGNCTMNTPVNVVPAAAVACAPEQTGTGAGSLRWAFDGTLNPGGTGTVLFQVKVN